MNLKKMAALAASAVMALSLAACGGTDKAGDGGADDKGAAASQAKVEGDTFTVGFDANFPPYGYKDEVTGEYVGFDLDLAAEVAKRNGWEYKAQPIDWDAKDMELDSGTIDVIWNGFTMNGREDAYTWSQPYVDNSIVFVVKADSGIESAADLAGKAVLVQADSSGLAAVEDEANAELVGTFASLEQVPDYNTAFMTMESGAADAVVVDQGVANYQLKQRGDAFKQLAEPLQVEQYAVGFKLGNEALRDQVQATLDDIKADGTFMQLAEKYEIQDAVIQ